MNTFLQRIYTRFFPDPQVIPWIGGTKLSKDSWAIMQEKGAPTADQLNNMAFTLDLLRPGDVFVDVGANAGTYCILASGIRSAYSYAIESDHTAFEHLQTNIQLNHLEKLVTAIQTTSAVSSDERQLVATPHAQVGQTLDTKAVPIHTLDKLIRRMPDLIKIDAQALEKGLLQRGLQFLMAPYLKVIILEQAGRTEGEVPQILQQQLRDLQFGAYTYEPEQRKLKIINPAETHSSIIYCHDLEWVKLRVSIADKVKAFPHRLKQGTPPPETNEQAGTQHHS